MKFANTIKISVFVKPEENEQEIKDALLRLIPFDIGQEKIIISRQTAQGFNERKILTYEIDLVRDKHINKFLEFLNEKIGKSQKDLLLKQIDTRLDDELNFFIRLDKQPLIQGNYLITDSGDCYHIKIGVAAFPRKKEVAARIIKEIFK